MSQPTGFEPATPMPKRETPGIAIASLVCGLASFVCLANVLTGIPAVITGHLALGRIKRSAGALGGRGMAIAGLILGYTSIVVVVFAVIELMIGGIEIIGPQNPCMANLKRIGKACIAYAAVHDGRYPERLSELYPDYVPDLDVFVCPTRDAEITSPDEIDAKSSYEYRGAALNASTAPEPPYEAILACDKPGNHRRGKHILYADGHVEFEGMGGDSRTHGTDRD